MFFILEDRLIASPVRIRKTDAASGKTIGKPGMLIELLRKGEDGAYEVMEFDAHYPDSHKVSVFSIPASGIVQFPEKLAYGSYAIREVEAVAPYLLRTEPIYFEVSKEHDWASHRSSGDRPSQRGRNGNDQGGQNRRRKQGGHRGSVLRNHRERRHNNPRRNCPLQKRRHGPNGRDQRTGSLDGGGAASETAP